MIEIEIPEPDGPIAVPKGTVAEPLDGYGGLIPVDEGDLAALDVLIPEPDGEVAKPLEGYGGLAPVFD